MPSAVKFFLKHYQESAEKKTLSQALKEYVDEKSRNHGREIISRRQYDSIKHETERFQRFIGDPIVGEIQTDQVKKYLDVGRTGLKTWNNPTFRTCRISHAVSRYQDGSPPS